MKGSPSARSPRERFRKKSGKEESYEKASTQSKEVSSASKSRENRSHSSERSSRLNEGQPRSCDRDQSRTNRKKAREVTRKADKSSRSKDESHCSNIKKVANRVPSLLDMDLGDKKADDKVLQRHVNQIFIRGDNVVMIALMQ
jgi:small nuclear ribonucleoprotein (snRNP)-like protein